MKTFKLLGKEYRVFSEGELEEFDKKLIEQQAVVTAIATLLEVDTKQIDYWSTKFGGYDFNKDLFKRSSERYCRDLNNASNSIDAIRHVMFYKTF